MQFCDHNVLNPKTSRVSSYNTVWFRRLRFTPQRDLRESIPFMDASGDGLNVQLSLRDRWGELLMTLGYAPIGSVKLHSPRKGYYHPIPVNCDDEVETNGYASLTLPVPEYDRVMPDLMPFPTGTDHERAIIRYGVVCENAPELARLRNGNVVSMWTTPACVDRFLRSKIQSSSFSGCASAASVSDTEMPHSVWIPNCAVFLEELEPNGLYRRLDPQAVTVYRLLRNCNVEDEDASVAWVATSAEFWCRNVLPTVPSPLPENQQHGLVPGVPNSRCPAAVDPMVYILRARNVTTTMQRTVDKYPRDIKKRVEAFLKCEGYTPCTLSLCTFSGHSASFLHTLGRVVCAESVGASFDFGISRKRARGRGRSGAAEQQVACRRHPSKHKRKRAALLRAEQLIQRSFQREQGLDVGSHDPSSPEGNANHDEIRPVLVIAAITQFPRLLLELDAAFPDRSGHSVITIPRISSGQSVLSTSSDDDDVTIRDLMHAHIVIISHEEYQRSMYHFWHTYSFLAARVPDCGNDAPGSTHGDAERGERKEVEGEASEDTEDLMRRQSPSTPPTQSVDDTIEIEVTDPAAQYQSHMQELRSRYRNDLIRGVAFVTPNAPTLSDYAPFLSGQSGIQDEVARWVRTRLQHMSNWLDCVCNVLFVKWKRVIVYDRDSELILGTPLVTIKMWSASSDVRVPLGLSTMHFTLPRPATLTTNIALVPLVCYPGPMEQFTIRMEESGRMRRELPDGESHHYAVGTVRAMYRFRAPCAMYPPIFFDGESARQSLMLWLWTLVNNIEGTQKRMEDEYYLGTIQVDALRETVGPRQRREYIQRIAQRHTGEQAFGDQMYGHCPVVFNDTGTVTLRLAEPTTYTASSGNAFPRTPPDTMEQVLNLLAEPPRLFEHELFTVRSAMITESFENEENGIRAGLDTICKKAHTFLKALDRLNGQMLANKDVHNVIASHEGKIVEAEMFDGASVPDDRAPGSSHPKGECQACQNHAQVLTMWGIQLCLECAGGGRCPFTRRVITSSNCAVFGPVAGAEECIVRLGNLLTRSRGFQTVLNEIVTAFKQNQLVAILTNDTSYMRKALQSVGCSVVTHFNVRQGDIAKIQKYRRGFAKKPLVILSQMANSTSTAPTIPVDQIIITDITAPRKIHECNVVRETLFARATSLASRNEHGNVDTFPPMKLLLYYGMRSSNAVWEALVHDEYVLLPDTDEPLESTESLWERFLSEHALDISGRFGAWKSHLLFELRTNLSTGSSALAEQWVQDIVQKTYEAFVPKEQRDQHTLSEQEQKRSIFFRALRTTVCGLPVASDE